MNEPRDGGEEDKEVSFDYADVRKNIWYTSTSIIVPSIFTYFFWFVTARTVGAEAVGIASAISSLVIIIATIDGLNMSLGMKRTLGIAISKRDIGKYKQVLASTVLFASILVTISAILIAIPNLQILEILKIDRQYVWIIIALLFGYSFQYIFSEALIAALRSKNLIVPILIGSLIRFPLLFCFLLLFRAPTMGTIIAYSSLIFITAISFGIYSTKVFSGSKVRALGDFHSNVKHVLNAGLASWIPQTAKTCGYWLGIIAVFSSSGAAAGGKFYMAIGIFTVTLFIVYGITKVTHALIASINKKEQQSRFLAYSIKIAFMFTMPIATPLLFFSRSLLELVGKEFGSAADSLSIFMISVPLVIISEMIFYFVYGRGDNKLVLYLGLLGNVPRIILYFILSPIFGFNGAAIAYLIGSVTQLVFSIKVGKSILLVMQFKEYIILTLVPLIIGSVTWLINMNFVLATIAIFAGSFTIYVKMGLFTERELRNLLYTGLPEGIAGRIYRISKVMFKINR